jgi:hypothetical protein
MAERNVPGGSYVNDAQEAALYQRQAPGSVYINETEQTAGEAATVFWVGTIE